MNRKEITEIKKQFSDKHCVISKLGMCYVNAGEKAKVYQGTQLLDSIHEEEAAHYLQIFKKGLSGTLGKNLFPLEFPLSEEADGYRQNFLMKLRESRLKDPNLLDLFYDQVIANYKTEEGFLIFLADCNYDVPGRDKNNAEMEDASDEVYHFIYCCICPVTASKPALVYSPRHKCFIDRPTDYTVQPPENAFVFPAFNLRTTDIHECLYYTKNAKNMGEDLICNILGCRVPVPANVQREAFQSILQETVGDSGELPIIQNIHDNLVGLIAEHKEDETPLELSKKDIERLLENSGMGEKELHNFSKSFDELAGENTSLLASNIIDAKVFEVRLPDVVIKVNPDRADLVETQTIDGKRCVVIQADQGIEVNGVKLAVK